MNRLLLIAILVTLAPHAVSARHHHHHFTRHASAVTDHDTTSLPHPAGCPARLFCGCGVSVDVFGKPIQSLYLAIAWAHRFARTVPAPGMVAARNGHVMRLREHISDDLWMVYDPNGGRGGTWLHPRSIRGYIIVDPNAPIR